MWFALLLCIALFQPAQWERVTETRRVTYYAEHGGPYMDVSRTERYLDKLESLTGHRLQTHWTIYRYRNEKRLSELSGFEVGGFTDSESMTVHSPEAFQPHELIHLFLSECSVKRGPLYDEGIAVVLGDGGKVNGKSVKRYRLRMELVGDMNRSSMTWDAKDYLVAGAIVDKIVKRKGLRQTLADWNCLPTDTKGVR